MAVPLTATKTGEEEQEDEEKDNDHVQTVPHQRSASAEPAEPPAELASPSTTLVTSRRGSEDEKMTMPASPRKRKRKVRSQGSEAIVCAKTDLPDSALGHTNRMARRQQLQRTTKKNMIVGETRESRRMTYLRCRTAMSRRSHRRMTTMSGMTTTMRMRETGQEMRATMGPTDLHSRAYACAFLHAKHRTLLTGMIDTAMRTRTTTPVRSTSIHWSAVYAKRSVRRNPGLRFLCNKS